MTIRYGLRKEVKNPDGSSFDEIQPAVYAWVGNRIASFNYTQAMWFGPRLCAHHKSWVELHEPMEGTRISRVVHRWRWNEVKRCSELDTPNEGGREVPAERAASDEEALRRRPLLG